MIMQWRRKWQPSPVFLGFSYGSTGKESAWNAGDLGSIPESGRTMKEYIPVVLSHQFVVICYRNPRKLKD